MFMFQSVVAFVWLLVRAIQAPKEMIIQFVGRQLILSLIDYSLGG